MLLRFHPFSIFRRPKTLNVFNFFSGFVYFSPSLVCFADCFSLFSFFTNIFLFSKFFYYILLRIYDCNINNLLHFYTSPFFVLSNNLNKNK